MIISCWHLIYDIIVRNVYLFIDSMHTGTKLFTYPFKIWQLINCTYLTFGDVFSYLYCIRSINNYVFSPRKLKCSRGFRWEIIDQSCWKNVKIFMHCCANWPVMQGSKGEIVQSKSPDFVNQITFSHCQFHTENILVFAFTLPFKNTAVNAMLIYLSVIKKQPF